MGVGDSDVNILMRAFFARAISLHKPPSLDIRCAAVIRDLNSLVRGIPLMGTTIDGVEAEPWVCQTMGDVLRRVANRITGFFVQYNARCVVLSLDQCSPVAKQIVQVKRKCDTDREQERTGRLPYVWTATEADDYTVWFNDDMECSMTWGDIFYHATAKRRFQEYLTHFLIKQYRMPIERMLVLDGMVLKGRRVPKPILLHCDNINQATVNYWPDHPPRWNYSESDWRIGFWLQELANEQLDEPIVVVEDDFDVLHLALQVQRALMWAYGPKHTPIYVLRQRQFWDGEHNRYVKVPEYVDLALLYRDISWLFGSVLARNDDPADRLHHQHHHHHHSHHYTDPLDAFTSLVLLRGDDYSQSLDQCTIVTLWRCFFEHGHTMPWFLESPQRDGRYDDEPRRWLVEPVSLRIHFAAMRTFVDHAYELKKEERAKPVKKDNDSTAVAAAAASSSSSSGRKRRASVSKESEAKRPAGWPDDAKLQVMAANMAWNLDNLANGWRPGFRSENELQTRNYIANDGIVPLSFYGWERRAVPVGKHGAAAMRVVYAERVYPRSVFCVEHNVDPVKIGD